MRNKSRKIYNIFILHLVVINIIKYYICYIVKWYFGFNYGDVSVFGVYAGDQPRYGVIGIGPVKLHRYHHALFNQRKFPGQSFGVIARQTEPRPRDGSATTRFVVNGSSPRSTASTEAKKLFKSMQI